MIHDYAAIRLIICTNCNFLNMKRHASAREEVFTDQRCQIDALAFQKQN